MSVSNHSEVKTSKIGLLAMIAICVGLVIVQGSMISALQGLGSGGSAFVLAMFCALIIAQCNAASFAELSLMFPAEGTLATYTQKAIGHFPAIVATFAGYVVVAVLAIPVEMLLVEAMLGQLFPDFAYIKWVPVAILVLLMFTNLIGADVFSKVQNVLSFTLICALIIVGSVAVVGADGSDTVTNAINLWDIHAAFNGDFIGLIALAMWLMVGVEFICPMINQVKSPQKNIPRAMQLSLVIIFAVFLLFIAGASKYMSVEMLTSSQLPFLIYTEAVFGETGLIIATVLALTATCSTVNTVLASVPRMLHGMAEQKQAFPQLKAMNRFGAPWLATLLLAGCTLIPYLFFEADSLIILVIAATTSWLMAYIVAHVDVMVLRRTMPNKARPFRTPLYPVPQVLGIVAMIYVIANNSPDPAITKQVFTITGSILLTISVIAAIWVKFYMKKGLFETDAS